MEETKDKLFPENWLIDTGIGLYWKHKEGIWVNDDAKKALRVNAVYLNLLEIPEAKKELDDCNYSCFDKLEEPLLNFLKPVCDNARASRPVATFDAKTGGIVDPEIENLNTPIIETYKTWVDKWCLSSGKMLELVASKNQLDFMFGLLKELGVSKSATLKLFKTRIIDVYNELKVKGLDNFWAWKVLLSPETRSMDATLREMARRKVQSIGYNRIEEKALLTSARYWIIVRVLKYSELQLLMDLFGSQAGFNWDESNFSTKVLKPFDDALLEPAQKTGPGRPLGSKTIQSQKQIEEVADVHPNNII